MEERFCKMDRGIVRRKRREAVGKKEEGGGDRDGREVGRGIKDLVKRMERQGRER